MLLTYTLWQMKVIRIGDEEETKISTCSQQRPKRNF